MEDQHLAAQLDQMMNFDDDQLEMEIDDEWEDIDDDKENEPQNNPVIEENIATAQKLSKAQTHVHFGPKLFDPDEWSID